MAGPISLHTQTSRTFNTVTPTGEPVIGAYVSDVTTDEDTHSALLIATLSSVGFTSEAGGLVRFYRTGTGEGDDFAVLGDPVGPGYTFSGLADTSTPCVTIIAVDPDPPETGAYAITLESLGGDLTFTVADIVALTF